MTVSGIDNDNVHLGIDEGLDPVVVVDSDGGPNAKSSSVIPYSPRILLETVDIPHRNKSREFPLAGNKQ